MKKRPILRPPPPLPEGAPAGCITCGWLALFSIPPPIIAIVPLALGDPGPPLRTTSAADGFVLNPVHVGFTSRSCAVRKSRSSLACLNVGCEHSFARYDCSCVILSLTNFSSVLFTSVFSGRGGTKKPRCDSASRSARPTKSRNRRHVTTSFEAYDGKSVRTCTLYITTLFPMPPPPLVLGSDTVTSSTPSTEDVYARGVRTASGRVGATSAPPKRAAPGANGSAFMDPPSLDPPADPPPYPPYVVCAIAFDAPRAVAAAAGNISDAAPRPPVVEDANGAAEYIMLSA